MHVDYNLRNETSDSASSDFFGYANDLPCFFLIFGREKLSAPNLKVVSGKY